MVKSRLFSTSHFGRSRLQFHRPKTSTAFMFLIIAARHLGNMYQQVPLQSDIAIKKIYISTCMNFCKCRFVNRLDHGTHRINYSGTIISLGERILNGI